MRIIYSLQGHRAVNAVKWEGKFIKQADIANLYFDCEIKPKDFL